MILCPKCGYENSDEAINCNNCRINLQSAIANAEKVKDNIPNKDGLLRCAKCFKKNPSAAEFCTCGFDFHGSFGRFLNFISPWLILGGIAVLIISVFAVLSGPAVPLGSGWRVTHGIRTPIDMVYDAKPDKGVGYGFLFGILGIIIGFCTYSAEENWRRRRLASFRCIRASSASYHQFRDMGLTDQVASKLAKTDFLEHIYTDWRPLDQFLSCPFHPSDPLLKSVAKIVPHTIVSVLRSKRKYSLVEIKQGEQAGKQGWTLTSTLEYPPSYWS